MSNASFVLELIVDALKGTLTTLIPGIEPVVGRLQKELLEPVSSSTVIHREIANKMNIVGS